jgi:hypothetical protein
MRAIRSSSSSGAPRRPAARRLFPLCAAAIVAVAYPAAAGAQSRLEASCRAMAGPASAECLLAVAATRAVQERVGLALWGGNPVPGTASTLGMRIGATPRASLSARLDLVPVELPPLLDRARSGSERAWVQAASGQATVGVFQGWSPLPTVGGVLSVDLLARLSAARLPRGAGFDQGAALGWSAGVRIGALRESFTMPGLSLTTSYGRSTAMAFGDPAGQATDGFSRGSVSNLNATLAASRRMGPLRLTAGVAGDRYSTDALVGYRDPVTASLATDRGRVSTDRRSWFGNVSWTALIFHTSAEFGWQEIPEPGDLPAGVSVDPVGWWAGVAFRLSI